METSIRNFAYLLDEIIPHPLVLSSIPSKKRYRINTGLNWIKQDLTGFNRIKT
jgi:hypothetical protein